ncbi:MAG: hypothetical protein ACOH2K_02385 [Burkholderiaceae bacterium]
MCVGRDGKAMGFTHPTQLELADCGHCLQVDIRAQNARSKRRLILLQSAEELQALNRIKRIFEDVDPSPDGPEGNYRQRQYRLKAVLAEVK